MNYKNINQIKTHYLFIYENEWDMLWYVLSHLTKNIYELNLRIRPDDDGPGTLIISSDN